MLFRDQLFWYIHHTSILFSQTDYLVNVKENCMKVLILSLHDHNGSLAYKFRLKGRIYGLILAIVWLRFSLSWRDFPCPHCPPPESIPGYCSQYCYWVDSGRRCRKDSISEYSNVICNAMHAYNCGLTGDGEMSSLILMNFNLEGMTSPDMRSSKKNSKTLATSLTFLI